MKSQQALAGSNLREEPVYLLIGSRKSGWNQRSLVIIAAGIGLRTDAGRNQYALPLSTRNRIKFSFRQLRRLALALWILSGIQVFVFSSSHCAFLLKCRLAVGNGFDQ
jgi:hypothetical protein